MPLVESPIVREGLPPADPERLTTRAPNSAWRVVLADGWSFTAESFGGDDWLVEVERPDGVSKRLRDHAALAAVFGRVVLDIEYDGRVAHVLTALVVHL